MPRRDKSADRDKQKRQALASEKGNEPKGVVRPDAEARAWAAANKLQGVVKKAALRRNLPNGPLGGAGRKTNLARSS